ncbi:MAG: GtrA family protein [Hahellaceae bacterium]|nr:GtrA family protein [Hahellaceae bacterium]MCP5168979.1 GtrA family protein [Hahellaceae bacterium]
MSSDSPFYSRLSRFLLSGGLATSLHWLLMWLLIQSGTDATVATGAGAALGACVNYLLQYYYSFRCREPHRVVFFAYVQTCVAGWLANLALFYLLFHFLLPQAAIAQFCTTGLVTFLNFFLYQKVVFHARSRS